MTDWQMSTVEKDETRVLTKYNMCTVTQCHTSMATELT